MHSCAIDINPERHILTVTHVEDCLKHVNDQPGLALVRHLPIRDGPRLATRSRQVIHLFQRVECPSCQA